VESEATSAETEVVVWDWRTNKQHWVLGKHKAIIFDVEFSPDGRWLASVSEDSVVKLWDATHLDQAQQGRELRPASASREFPRVGFSPDSKRLVTGDGFDGVLILDLESGNPFMPALRGHGGIVTVCACSRDGGWVASGGTDQTVRLWDAHTGRPIRTWTGHSGVINALAFSPNGRWLASGSADATIKLWRLNVENTTKDFP